MRVSTGTWGPGGGWGRGLREHADAEAEARDRTLVLVFFHPDVAAGPAPLDELSRLYGGAVVAGCSTAGQILDGWSVDDGAVAVAVTFARARPRAVRVDWDEAPSAYHVGQLLGRRATPEGAQGLALLVFADGYAINGSGLVDGLASAVPEGTGISGGLAGDAERFGGTWVYADGQVRRRGAVAVALSDPGLQVRYAVAGGWDGFGPFRQVTRSKGNTLYELDGRPALELYREYLGDRASALPGSALLFPLELTAPTGDVRVVRTILGVDAATSSMTFAGSMPQGWTARLMRTSLDRLVDAVETAAHESLEPGWADVVLAVSCVGRRLVLGERTDEEVDAVRQAVGESTPVVGFFSYGEINPLGTCSVQNQTVMLTAMREADP